MPALATRIHSTAIIEKGAQLDTSVQVGPYAYIGEKVKIGANSIIHHHASVEGFTEMGSNNQVFPYAYIGGKTHDIKFQGGNPGLKIGSHNIFREYTTIHLATQDGDFTIFGSNNVILAYSHIAHDCIVGNHLIMSSHSALGGHTLVKDYVNIGWGVGIHQFCQVGTYAMIGACSKVVQDVPPYMTVDGSPAGVRMINRIGLERRGFSPQDIDLVKIVFKMLYKEGLNRSQALNKLKTMPHADSIIFQNMITFIQSSQRGLL